MGIEDIVKSFEAATVSAYDQADAILSEMIQNYRNDERVWLRDHSARPKSIDAVEIAAAMSGLIKAKPDMCAWLMAIALQRLGDDG